MTKNSFKYVIMTQPWHEMFFVLMFFCEENPLSLKVFPHKVPVMWNFDILVVSPSKMLNKQLS